ncbi:hypothetical protein HPB49_008423 [Dermacentor silvarum]|uniref:Uncharacterized protein n=1 Tax=Dermacentor silvarum TaxID=543639 RepID=A0ACB8C8G2_DERSI|nr:hypothetical protein HPB49_008423 [Dermacentor silvarum]
MFAERYCFDEPVDEEKLAALEKSAVTAAGLELVTCRTYSSTWTFPTADICLDAFQYFISKSDRGSLVSHTGVNWLNLSLQPQSPFHSLNMKHILVLWKDEEKWDIYPITTVVDASIGLELMGDPCGALKRLESDFIEIKWDADKPPAPAKILAVDSARMVKRRKHILDKAGDGEDCEPVAVVSAPKVDLGEGVLLDDGTLTRLRRDAKNSGSSLARGPLKLLLTAEEQENKSLFGWRSNAHKDAAQKEALDPRRVNTNLSPARRPARGAAITKWDSFRTFRAAQTLHNISDIATWSDQL